MLYKIATVVVIIGCLFLLTSIALDQLKGFSIPYLKPVLWVTMAALFVRMGIRFKKK